MFNKAKAYYAAMGKPRIANPFKRTVNIVYTSERWLLGNYVFTFKAGAGDLRAKMIDHMISNMQDSPAATYDAARAVPALRIVDIY